MPIRTIGHYHVVEELGAGAMGRVYRATDLVLRRDVALKILDASLSADAVRLARLKREACVLASFNHPNIAVVHDLVDDGTTHALVMELVEGPTIADALCTGPYPPEKVAPIALQIADALAAAHDAGVIHRDLKPANVKIGTAGTVKVLDFGLAANVEGIGGLGKGHDTLVQPPEFGGTLAYMAPEQLRGDEVDRRADVYALGAVLYEMVVGRPPFGEARGAALIGAVQHEAPLSPRSFNPRIPRGLEEIVLRCLAKDPERRFPSMREVAAALRALSSKGADERSLAVLYFENLARDDDGAVLCDGITEDIIVELSKIRGLAVLPRSSVLAWRERAATVTEAGHALGVSHVLDGSLRRADDRLRVTATLVETASSRTVWAERYDRDLDDVFAIQEEIARSIAQALRVVLTEEERRAIGTAPTTNVAAYEAYLHGRQHFQLFRRRSIEFARDEFARAIEIDPEYALAYAGLSDCYAYLYMFWVATEENAVGADAASGRAVELGPDCAEAHVARGVAVSLRGEHEQAEREFLRGIALDRELFEAHYFCARGHYARGHLDDAVAWFRQAHEVRPDDYQAPCMLASALAGLGRDEESAETYRLTQRLCQKHLELHPGDTRAIYFAALACARLGEREEALVLAERALGMDPDEPQVVYNVGCVHALLGSDETAIDLLERVMAHGDWWRRWCAHDPDLVGLHEDARYRALVGEA